MTHSQVHLPQPKSDYCNEGATRRPDEADPQSLSHGFVRPSLSYPPRPRASPGKIRKTSPLPEPRNPLIETALRPLFGMPIEIVEPGTVVRAARTGEECTVDDDHPAISERRIFMTRQTYMRLEEHRDRLGCNLAVPA